MGAPMNIPDHLASMANEVHLLIPDLFPFGLGRSTFRFPQVPALETFLARADRYSQSINRPAEYLCRLFGVSPQDGDLPEGALCRLADTGHADHRWWFRVQPVHLRTDLDRVVLSSAPLGLMEAEATELREGIKAHFQGEGWRLETPVPERWYLGVENTPRLRTISVDQVCGGDMAEFLPTGDDGLRWQGFMNELQMLLHGSDVNRHRQSRGELPANGVWIWGGGRVPALPSATRWSNLWANTTQCLAHGLARVAGVPRHFLPASLEPLLAYEGDALVVEDSFSAAFREQNIEAWLDALVHWEHQWFQPLLSALRDGAIGAATLYGGSSVFHLERRHLWRLWRRRRPFKKTLE